MGPCVDRSHFISLIFLLFVSSFQWQQAAGASSQAGPQAELSILDANISSCFYQAHSWNLNTIVTSANDTDAIVVVSATINGSTPNKSLRIAGTLQLKNTGDAPATIGNIALVLQKSFPRVGMVALCADVANAFFGSTATTSVSVQKKTVSDTTICSSSTTDSCTIPDMSCAGDVIFYQDGIYSDVWSISPRKTVAAGETLLLVYETVMDATALNLTAGDVLRMEALVTFGNVKERCGKANCVASFLDIDGDGTISSDEVYVRTVVLRNTFTLNQSVELFPNATLIDGSQTFSTVNITADLVSVDSPDSDTDTHVITANTNVTMVFHRTDNGTTFGGLNLCASLNFADAPTMTVSVLYAVQDLVLPCVIMPNLTSCASWTVHPLPVNLLTCFVDRGTVSTPVSIGRDRFHGILPDGFIANNFNTLYPHNLTFGLLAYHYINFTNALSLLSYMRASTLSLANLVILHANTVNPPLPLSIIELNSVVELVNTALFPGLPLLYYCPWNSGFIGLWFSTFSGLQVRDIINLEQVLISGAPFPSQYYYNDIPDFQSALTFCWSSSVGTCTIPAGCPFRTTPCNTAGGTTCTISTATGLPNGIGNEWAILSNSTLNSFRAKLALNPNPYVIGRPNTIHMTFHSFDDMLNYVLTPPANGGSSYLCTLSATVDSPTVPPCPLAADLVALTMALTLFPKIAAYTYSFTGSATTMRGFRAFDIYVQGTSYLSGSGIFVNPAQLQDAFGDLMAAYPVSGGCAGTAAAGNWVAPITPT